MASIDGTAPTAAVYGCEGLQLSRDEQAFFSEVRPFGFILFARNCSEPQQVRTLAAQLRDTVQRGNAPVLIDQEGGRVARLGPPHWKKRPPARRIGEIFEHDPDKGRAAAYLHARLIAHDLERVGVNVNCAPVLDVPSAGSHDVIGDRAYSTKPGPVIELGRAAIEGYLDGGVLPIIKHIPGHGRAMADSHFELPRVAATAKELSLHDFLTFRGLNHAPIAMTAHVVYEAFDPKRPATTSPRVIGRVVRGEIGFGGLLVSDDLSMKALAGPLSERAKAALFAGCDIVLHCNGKLDEMREIASKVKPLTGESAARADAAIAALRVPAPLDIKAAEAHLDDMVGATA
jgi:beta-N-acetylhexosaminidase